MIEEKLIDELCKSVRDLLSDDMVSIGEVRQVARVSGSNSTIFLDVLRSILTRLLEADVEVGRAANSSGDYVEFVGWRGSPEVKVEKVLTLIREEPSDEDFSLWLALRSNVDRFENIGPASI